MNNPKFFFMMIVIFAGCLSVKNAAAEESGSKGSEATPKQIVVPASRGSTAVAVTNEKGETEIIIKPRPAIDAITGKPVHDATQDQKNIDKSVVVRDSPVIDVLSQKQVGSQQNANSKDAELEVIIVPRPKRDAITGEIISEIEGTKGAMSADDLDKEKIIIKEIQPVDAITGKPVEKKTY